jgi:hypothetical protein
VGWGFCGVKDDDGVEDVDDDEDEDAGHDGGCAVGREMDRLRREFGEGLLLPRLGLRAKKVFSSGSAWSSGGGLCRPVRQAAAVMTTICD